MNLINILKNAVNLNSPIDINVDQVTDTDSETEDINTNNSNTETLSRDDRNSNLGSKIRSSEVGFSATELYKLRVEINNFLINFILKQSKMIKLNSSQQLQHLINDCLIFVDFIKQYKKLSFIEPNNFQYNLEQVVIYYNNFIIMINNTILGIFSTHLKNKNINNEIEITLDNLKFIFKNCME
jgi:hypothetical protein